MTMGGELIGHPAPRLRTAGPPALKLRGTGEEKTRWATVMEVRG